MTGHDTTWNKIQLLCGSTGDGDSLAEAESQHSGGDRLRAWGKVDHLRLDSLDLRLEFTWIIMIISFDSLWLFLGCPIGLSIYRWSPLKGLMMRKHHKPHAKWDDPPGMATAWAGTVLEAICHTICHCQPVAPHHERKNIHVRRWRQLYTAARRSILHFDYPIFCIHPFSFMRLARGPWCKFELIPLKGDGDCPQNSG